MSRDVEERVRRSTRWLVAVVPLTAAVVALAQMTVASTTELTPWRGAGFGMFSTLDSHDTRLLRGTVVDTEGRSFALPQAVLRSSELHDEYVSARAFPSDAHLRRLGRAVLVSEPVRGLDNDAEVDVAEVSHVTLEVLGVRLDVTTGRLHWRSVGRAKVVP